jgi:uncharacterized protein Veg
MRNIFLAIFVSFGFLGVAQQITISSKLNASEITKEGKSGHFQWVFPASTTAEAIQNTAKYYTTSFTYTYDVTTQKVDVYPVLDSDEVRRIMLRFLGANQVNKIIVGEESYELYSYYESFMKIKGE